MSYKTLPSALLQPFYPALNGLRALAFLMVFATHYCQAHWDISVVRWGWTGVDLFFVLSGFLITGILYDSLHKEDYFQVFYLRRALRIFPLFYGFWIVLLLLTPLAHFAWNRYNLSMALYGGNFFIPGGLLSQHAPPTDIAFHASFLGNLPAVIYIGHFWSLCVEEQFYIIWPAVIWLLRKRSSLIIFCLVVIVSMPFLRGLYAHLQPLAANNDGIYTNTFFRADSLLVGGLLALWLRGTAMAAGTIRRAAAITAVAAPVLLAICFCLEHSHPNEVSVVNDHVVRTFGYTLITITGGALLMLAIDSGTWLARSLQWRPLSSLGRISYGLYFYHGLVSVMVAAEAANLHRMHLTFLVPLVAFPLTVGTAWLSFHFYETPFLRLKDRFTRLLRKPPNEVVFPSPVPDFVDPSKVVTLQRA